MRLVPGNSFAEIHCIIEIINVFSLWRDHLRMFRKIVCEGSRAAFLNTNDKERRFNAGSGSGKIPAAQAGEKVVSFQQLVIVLFEDFIHNTCKVNNQFASSFDRKAYF